MCLLLNAVCVTHIDTQQRYRDAVQAWRLKDLLLMSERAAYYHVSAEASTAVAVQCLSVSHAYTQTETDVTGNTELQSSVFQYRMRQGHFCHTYHPNTSHMSL